MRYARHTIKFNVVTSGIPTEHAAGAATQLTHTVEIGREFFHRLPRQFDQRRHMLLTLLDFRLDGVIILRHHATPINLIQSVIQRIDQCLAARWVVEQIVLQIGVALYHPDVAQYLVQHACRTPRLAQAAQLGDQVPCRIAQQTDHDLAIRE